MATLYTQTIYDTGLATTVRYTLQYLTATPSPSVTTPTGSGSYDPSTHRIVQQVENHKPQFWLPVSSYGDLPNDSALQPGDLCYVTGVAQYIYTGTTWILNDNDGSADAGIFIYDSGATQAGNVYSNSTDLAAACAAFSGTVRILMRTNLTFTTNLAIRTVIFEADGIGGIGDPKVLFFDGTQLTTMSVVLRNIRVNWNSVTDPIIAFSETGGYLQLDSVWFHTEEEGTIAPVIELTGAVDNASIVATGINDVENYTLAYVDSGCTLTASIDGTITVSDVYVDGNGTVTVEVTTPSYSFPVDISDLSSFTGTYNCNLRMLAKRVQYQDNAPSLGVTNVQEAIEEVKTIANASKTSLQSLKVGNALNGSDSYDCAYLDPGDGTGIAAAFAYVAANPPIRFVVYIGPGTYTLTAANPLLTIPANTVVVGAGRGMTVIVGTSISGVNMNIFTVNAGAVLTDVTITSPAYVAGATALASSGIVTLSGIGQVFRRIALSFAGGAGAAHPRGIGFYYFSTTPPQGTEFYDCSVSITGTTAAQFSFAYGFSISTNTAGAHGAIPVVYERCSVTGDNQGNTLVTGWNATPSTRMRDCAGYQVPTVINCKPTTGTTSQGPDIDGLIMDFRGLSGRGIDFNTFSAIATTNTIIKGVRFIGDASTSSGTLAILVRADNTSTITNTIIEMESAGAVTLGGGVQFSATGGTITGAAVTMAATTSRFTSFYSSGAISDIVVTGSVYDVLVYGNSDRVRLSGLKTTDVVSLLSGTTNTSIEGCNLGSITIASSVSNTRIGGSTTYGSLSDSGTGTKVDRLMIDAVASGMSSSYLDVTGSTQTADGAYALYGVSYAAGTCTITFSTTNWPIGGSRTFEKMNTSANTIIFAPPSGGTINGAAADATMTAPGSSAVSGTTRGNMFYTATRTGSNAWQVRGGLMGYTATTTATSVGPVSATRYVATNNNSAATPSYMVEPSGDSGLYWDATKGIVASVDAIDRLMLRVDGITEIRRPVSGREVLRLLDSGGADCTMLVLGASPEGVNAASPGDVGYDIVNGNFYVKKTGVGNTGWLDISSPATSSVNGLLSAAMASQLAPTGPYLDIAASTATVDGSYELYGVSYAAGTCTITFSTTNWPIGSSRTFEKMNTSGNTIVFTPPSGGTINGAAADATMTAPGSAQVSGTSRGDMQWVVTRTAANAFRVRAGNPQFSDASSAVIAGGFTAFRFVASDAGSAAAPNMVVEPAGNSGFAWEATKGVMLSVDAVERTKAYVDGTFEIASGQGTARSILRLVSTAGTTNLFTTAATPEAVITAGNGSLAFDTTNAQMYVKTGGASNTGWINITALAYGAPAQAEVVVNAATATIAANTTRVRVTYASGNVTLTFASGYTAGARCVIYKENTTTNTIAVTPPSGGTVNGGTVDATMTLPGSFLASSTTEADPSWEVRFNTASTLRVS